MALVVHKATFDSHMQPVKITIPKDAFKVINVGRQGENVTVWYETLFPISDHGVPAYEYEMRIVPTGGEVPSGFYHVGTSVTSASTYVWHVYGRLNNT